MNYPKNYLALDFGASNGRALVGSYDGGLAFAMIRTLSKKVVIER